MENNSSDISRNYNIKLGSSGSSSSINYKSKNNYNNSNNNNNNKNYMVNDQKQSLWQIFIKASQLMTFMNYLVLDLRTI